MWYCMLCRCVGMFYAMDNTTRPKHSMQCLWPAKPHCHPFADTFLPTAHCPLPTRHSLSLSTPKHFILTIRHTNSVTCAVSDAS